MPRLKLLSGKQVIKILQKFGFSFYSQNGSHIKMRRIGVVGESQTLTVPDKFQLGKGMLHQLYSQALAYIPEEVLRPHFYTD